MIETEGARLVFDFPDDPSDPRSKTARTTLTAPEEVVLARTLGEVRPALARIEAAVQAGRHAAGFLTYEAAPAFEPAMVVRPGARMPLLWFGIFPPGHVENHAPREDAGPPARAREWTLEIDCEAHAAAVAAVREAIAGGRTYQVNLTARMRARWTPGEDREGWGRGSVGSTEAWRLYEGIRRAQGHGYHAFIETGRFAVLSASPELFFHTRGREIVTRPMKGTRRRGRCRAEDRRLRRELEESAKDRAENLMIVDLLRNDLGRICETGSVEVTDRHTVERYRTVWQMTSTVTGRLRPDLPLSDLLSALFPCGSVTGAPKISTMREIARLERSPREVYCGAIGWIRPDGARTFSVPIRTAWIDRDAGRISYGAGGGIVWDSRPAAEFDELRAKALVVREPWPSFELLETLRLDDGAYLRLERHLGRMRQSARYFGFPDPRPAVAEALRELAARHPDGRFRARVTWSQTGEATTTATPLPEVGRGTPPGQTPDRAAGTGAATVEPQAAALPVVVASAPVDSRNRFLYHKTTHRAVYDERRAAMPPGAFDILLRNERDELTELTRGNLVVEIDGDLFTPSRDSGLLAGCLREELLEKGTITERTLRTADLERVGRLWFINSARGWIPVRLTGGPTPVRSSP